MKGKRFFSVLMGACLAGGMLFASACGGNKGKVGVLRIDAFEGGGGGTYAQALADAYRKYNPEVAVEVNCNPLVPEEAPTALESKSSPTDVYMQRSEYRFPLRERGRRPGTVERRLREQT